MLAAVGIIILSVYVLNLQGNLLFSYCYRIGSLQWIQILKNDHHHQRQI